MDAFEWISFFKCVSHIKKLICLKINVEFWMKHLFTANPLSQSDEY